MAQDQVLHHQNLRLINPNQRPAARHLVVIRRRRKVLPAIRLGGKRPRRVNRLLRVFRKIRLRWLKLHYLCMLRKAKEYYRKTVSELKEASSTIEAFQQRVLLQASVALPGMGISFSTYTSVVASDPPRPFFM
ncbi:hypothetical protein FNV43_RR08115 [Rhamnella rubrinervis]|uniref:Uncharacterized protein n=1 Tax=Rhamnella rubrinervis TaxID=2594499 RepID=A0A8K0HH16_9ROSA|nr:hypothetical protein FNV43_RR08115 [Rhamnella rubrinervis]